MLSALKRALFGAGQLFFFLNTSSADNRIGFGGSASLSSGVSKPSGHFGMACISFSVHSVLNHSLYFAVSAADASPVSASASGFFSFSLQPTHDRIANIS